MSVVEYIKQSLRRHMSRCITAALLCASLSFSALGQGPMEVSITVLSSKTSVTCGPNTFDLVAVLANTPAPTGTETGAKASARGIALVRTGQAEPGNQAEPRTQSEPRTFARYWFSSGSQLLLKRDDDTGSLGSKLVDLTGPLQENVTDFFQGCVAQVDLPAIARVLNQASAQSSVEEVIGAFRANGLEFEVRAGSGPLSLGRELSITEADQILFAKAVRTFLSQQAVIQPAVGTGTPSPGPAAPHANAPGVAGTEWEAARKSLEETGKKIESVSSLQRSFLWGLVTAVVLAGVFIALLFFSPALKRKLLSSPGVAAEIRREVINDLYTGFQKICEPGEAQQSLDEILRSYRERFDEANGKTVEIKSAYHDLETELKKFSLSLAIDKDRGPDQNLEQEVMAVRQFLNDHCGVDFLKQNTVEGLNDLTRELNDHLSLFGGDDASNLRTLHHLRAATTQIKALWSRQSTEPCPEGALALIEKHWDTIQSELKSFEKIDPQNVLGYTRQSVALFLSLRDKFHESSLKPEDLNFKVTQFFNDLELMQRTYLSADNGRTNTPDKTVIALSVALGENKRKIAELNSLDLEVRNLQREFGTNDRTGIEVIGRAIKLAIHYRAALELLNAYRPSDDVDNIAEAVRAIQNDVQQATATVRQVLPEASGSITEAVSGLVAEYRSNLEFANNAREISDRAERLEGDLETSRQQAEDSGQLAGALSQYVNLSADQTLAPAEVRRVLGQFSAGEYIHRQLRLRLSAAVPALDHAIDDVRRAGREDGLDALKIGDFKERLRGLLTNMEEFAGDALWKNCLSSGFSQQWLHNLFRAALLAQTYFVDDQALGSLVDPLTEASQALRATIRRFDVRVPFLDLLSKPPAGARVEYEVDPKLSRLPEVKRKVQATLRAQSNFEDGLNFTIDVGSFPFKSKGTDDFGGRVIVVSAFEWMQ